MELKDYRAALVAGWKVVVGTVLVALLLGAAVAATSSGSSPSYTSDRKVFLALADHDAPAGSFPDPTLLSRTISYAQLLGGSVMADRVAKQVHLTHDELPLVVATPVADTTVLQLTVTGGDRSQVKAVADAYVDMLPGAIREVDAPNGRDTSAVDTTLISSTDDPEPAAPSGTPRILLLALMLGLGAGVCWALLRYQASAQGAAAARGAAVDA